MKQFELLEQMLREEAFRLARRAAKERVKSCGFKLSQYTAKEITIGARQLLAQYKDTYEREARLALIDKINATKL